MLPAHFQSVENELISAAHEGTSFPNLSFDTKTKGEVLGMRLPMNGKRAKTRVLRVAGHFHFLNI